MTEQRKSIQQNALKLACFAAACTALVSAVNWFTSPLIAEQLQLQTERQMQEVLPEKIVFGGFDAHCFSNISQQFLGTAEALPSWQIEKESQAVATVYQTVAPDGYNGDILLLVGIDDNDTVTGVRVLQHSETPGLGDKLELRKSDWINSFAGQRLNSDEDSRWAVKKDGGQFDSFTGATITPRAVVKAVRNTQLFHQTHASVDDANLQPCEQ
ncbi:electron transport complex subunit RsxG [Aliagarivorans taiwanensis]|uniref:electron transport complex subunit RsxG n=1 Tax=Aliagarivorans taiwanensis TaxID=561966 RepID=UPI0004139448|nr:electron transport complex subunit RsxG [Aliagarivorans taiwanensis]